MLRVALQQSLLLGALGQASLAEAQPPAATIPAPATTSVADFGEPPVPTAVAPDPSEGVTPPISPPTDPSLAAPPADAEPPPNSSSPQYSAGATPATTTPTQLPTKATPLRPNAAPAASDKRPLQLRRIQGRRGDASLASSPSSTSTAVNREEPESRYRGIFGSFIVPIMLGGKSTHSYIDDCPAKTYGGACDTSAPRGGGLGLRLGYFYEWVGIELAGAGAIDVSSTEMKLPPIPAISESMMNAVGRNVFVRAGGMFGIGLRVAVPMQGIRLSVGADLLYIHRKVVAIPDSFAGASLSYSVPGWLIDGGIQLGGTPGARFYLGAFALIEQAHDLPITRNLAAMGIDPALVPADLTKATIYRGRQVFYGPLLGIAFGH